jgi:Methyltransferase domain
MEMPTLDWIRAEFHYGYDSGDVLARLPGFVRFREERAIGGSYRKVFLNAVAPYLRSESHVLELGPGKGSWSRAILKYLPSGELHTVDLQDVTKWLHPEKYGARLVCHQVNDNTFDCLQESYFDFFWSFGVLCHNEVGSIRTILGNARKKVKPGAWSVHHYGDWRKLDRFGWKRGRVPVEFQSKPDHEIWWPRNDSDTMARTASEAGWEVVAPDMDMLLRDSMILLRNPG